MTRMSDPEQILADAIAALCDLRDPADHINQAINDLQDIKGRVWLAECRASDASGQQAARDEARDLAAYHRGVI